MVDRVRAAFLVLCVVFAGCAEPVEPVAEPGNDAAAAAANPHPNPLTQEMLPPEFDWLWEPWTGDLEGIVDRRALRVLLPYGGYQFYFDDGRPRGATFEMLVRLEDFLNRELGRRSIRVHVVPIPVSREQLIPGLLSGFGDIIATDLTITPQREALVSFTRPLLTGIDEVLVLGPAAEPLERIDDLAGREVFVRPTSSYAEHLRGLGTTFVDRGLAPPRIRAADELFEAEDILDLLRTGVADLTVMDEYKAEFWASAIDGIEVRSDLIIAEDQAVAWAMRKEDTQLAELLDRFMRRYGKGTAFGNDVYNRYLARPDIVRCANSTQAYEDVASLVELFRSFGTRYDFNWLMLAAQAYQESGLDQKRRSQAGAVGIMQIKPSTAADPNIAIPDVTTPENNIHAGTRYMRFLADRYFDDPEIGELDRWFFSLAAYNAGPARIAGYRREAADKGFDPDKWFDNVEIIAARRIGRETVTYVSNIYRLFVAYQLTMQRGLELDRRWGDVLVRCQDDGE